jgi:hypothetical protein
MAERWHPEPLTHTPDDDRCFVAEHERAFRDNREACFQLLKRLQREGSDPYAVVISVPVLSRIPIKGGSNRGPPSGNCCGSKLGRFGRPAFSDAVRGGALDAVWCTPVFGDFIGIRNDG